MMDIQRNPVALAVSTALALGAAGGAHAQGVLEEITVTAQKREQAVTDLPLSVTAFDGDTMRALGMDQPIDLAAQTPGLTIATTMGDSQPAVMLRGIGINDFNTNANPGVAVYVDEVARPIPAMLGFALYDMERVEVLKGPQGTLYGQNTTGGAVSFITKKPTDDFQGYVSVDAGDFDYTSIEAAIGGPLGENFRVRVAGVTTQQDEGFQKDVFSSRTAGKADRTAARIQLSADFGDNVDATLRYSYGRDRSDQQTSRIAENLETLQLYYYTTYSGSQSDLGFFDVLLGDSPSRLENEMDSLGLTVNADFDFGTLTSVTGWDDVNHRNFQPFSGTELAIQNADYGGNLKNLSQELRLTSEEGGLVDWIVGLYYSKVEQDNSSKIDFTDGLGFVFYYYGLYDEFPTTTIVDTAYTQDLTTTAAFAHTEWTLSDTLTLTLGARAAQDELSFDLTEITPPGTGACDGPFCDVIDYYYGLTDFDSAFGTFLNFSDGGVFDGPRSNGVFARKADNVDESYVTWKAGLDWAATDTTLIYGNVSQGTKAHGFYGGLAPSSPAYAAYKPEEVLAYELGLKTTFADGAARLDAAYFFYDYENQQMLVDMDPGIGLPNPNLTNIAKSEISGFEADLTWAPVDGLTTRVTMSVLDSEIKDNTVSSPLPVFPGALPPIGEKLAYAPDLTWSALVRYDFNVGNQGGAYAQVDADFEDKRYALPGRADTEMPDRTLVNARIGYLRDFASGSLELALWARNLGDEEYPVYRWNQGFAIYNEHVGAPRTWGVNVRYNFE